MAENAGVVSVSPVGSVSPLCAPVALSFAYKPSGTASEYVDAVVIVDAVLAVVSDVVDAVVIVLAVVSDVVLAVVIVDPVVTTLVVDAVVTVDAVVVAPSIASYAPISQYVPCGRAVPSITSDRSAVAPPGPGTRAIPLP